MKLVKNVTLGFIVLAFMVSCSKDNSIVSPTSDPVSLKTKVAKSDNTIKSAALPQKVIDYITSNYPGITINKTEVEKNGNYEVTLQNKVELIFNSAGDFLGIDNDTNDDFGDTNVAVTSLPKAILDFVALNYPTLTIVEAEKENNGNYELELSDKTEVVFDTDGNFLGIGVDKDNMDGENDDEHSETNVDPSALLQVIKDYITTNYPNQTIIEAEVENNGDFEITLSNKVELYFDANGKFLRMDK